MQFYKVLFSLIICLQFYNKGCLIPSDKIAKDKMYIKTNQKTVNVKMRICYPKSTYRTK